MIEYTNLPIRIESMRVEDIAEVLEVERESMPAPWSARAYEYELRYNELAHYYVARLQQQETLVEPGPRGWLASLFRPHAQVVVPAIVGYVGFWLMAGESHISTIAVAPKYRGRSFGELILVAALDRSMELHAHESTLEVRISNYTAQQLYLKYSFVKVGVRKGYYTDNNEDALIMTTPPLGSAEYQQRFQRLKQALLIRLRNPSSKARRERQHVRGGSVYGG